MGSLDRVVRALVAFVLVIIGLKSGIWWLYIIAGIFLVTAIVGFCPVYIPLGIRTNKEPEKKSTLIEDPIPVNVFDSQKSVMTKPVRTEQQKTSGQTKNDFGKKNQVLGAKSKAPVKTLKKTVPSKKPAPKKKR